MATTRKPRVKSIPSPAPTVTTPRRPQPDDEDGGFTDFLVTMRKRWSEVVKSQQPLFHTDVPNLYDIFLQNLSTDLRPHYACRCCRRFVERYGNVVTVQNGKLQSALWQGTMPAAFITAVAAMRQVVEAATISGVVVSGADTFGTPFSLAAEYGTAFWTHMAVEWPVARRFNSPLKTADAHAAALKEERKMLERGLSEFTVDQLNTALTLFTSGTLTRPEKGQPLVQWVLDQHAALSKLKGTAREHALWQIAVTAPAGFCHIRSGVVGTLLEDIVAGYDVKTIAKRWAEKLDPTQYMRAQVAPAAGQLKRAESVIDKMAAAGSLARRYAQDSDVTEAFWTPREAPIASRGVVFGHITAKKKPQAAALDLPEVRMTWDKFQRTALEGALSIEYQVPHTSVQFGALVTAANAEAPPILQWDDAAKRNPVSVYSAQSEPSNWGLQPGSFVTVSMITPMPYHWNGATTPNQKQGVLLALDGCSDRNRRTGGGFLPEFLRSDLREIRSALDAYAKQATVQQVEGPICGLALMNTSEVATAAAKAAPLGQDTDVILVFDESGSMSGKLREINAQAEAIRKQLSQDMPQARVRVLRFGSSTHWEPMVLARNFQPLRLDSNRGGTSLHWAISTACEAALGNSNPTLIYLLTDGEATDTQGSAPQLISDVLASGRVTFGCVGPAQAYRFFTGCGIPSACVRAWDGYNVRDLNAVTTEVAQGITSFAAARSSGATSISDFFTAPVSGFGDGVRLRVTSKGQRQIICLDRWD